MDDNFYTYLVNQALAEGISDEQCFAVLKSQAVELLPLLNSAFTVRKKFFGKDVLIHILNNVQNGCCPEDCRYCAQSQDSKSDIETYAAKPDTEILEEAKAAYENGAFRYCLVYSGRKLSRQQIEHLAGLVKRIKSLYPLEVCVSAGILDAQSMACLKESGVDRVNHNINTSERFYPQICTTHVYQDRIRTIQTAKANGLEVCSGVIIGMGEADDDIVEMARTLRKLSVASIPVNFFMPIPGLPLSAPSTFSPDYCLRVLCLFRFLNPSAEIRIAAGRELYLRDLEVMALYPANSLFLEGYLNTQGKDSRRTLQMIKDAGFTIVSEHGLDDLLDGNQEAILSASLELKTREKNQPADFLKNESGQP